MEVRVDQPVTTDLTVFDAALQALEEQRTAMSQTELQLRDAFAALSRDALMDNRTDFLETAGGLFSQVRDTLDKVQAQLADVD